VGGGGGGGGVGGVVGGWVGGGGGMLADEILAARDCGYSSSDPGSKGQRCLIPAFFRSRRRETATVDENVFDMNDENRIGSGRDARADRREPVARDHAGGGGGGGGG